LRKEKFPRGTTTLLWGGSLGTPLRLEELCWR